MASLPMPRTLWFSLPPLAAGLLAASLAGCQPAGAQPATAFPPDTQASERQYGSAMTVGFRVHLDQEEEEEAPRVRISAVVRDIDGEETTHELGEYEGTVTHQAAEGDEIARVRVDHPDGPQHLTVRMGSDGSLEVHHHPDAGERTTVRRIPLREGATVRVADEPVEHAR
ncbi:MAG: hypothetical protein R3B40_22220 [Polyangiales bacterium]|nr:hypothetical protein [Myxococcales bacterium]MCB9656826.1 hypothetical protein [Sandaracinaceae bacterium]